jgi:uncharacterized protein (DUF952 family)
LLGADWTATLAAEHHGWHNLQGLEPQPLAEAKAKGRFEGSAEDLRDGFIHFSSAEQLDGTLAKHYAGQEGLVLLAVDSESLGEHLQWEPSREGSLFPHLYGPLDLAAVNSIEELPLEKDGRDRLPAEISSLLGISRWRPRG